MKIRYLYYALQRFTRSWKKIVQKLKINKIQDYDVSTNTITHYVDRL